MFSYLLAKIVLVLPLLINSIGLTMTQCNRMMHEFFFKVKWWDCIPNELILFEKSASYKALWSSSMHTSMLLLMVISCGICLIMLCWIMLFVVDMIACPKRYSEMAYFPWNYHDLSSHHLFWYGSYFLVWYWGSLLPYTQEHLGILVLLLNHF